MSQRIPLIRQEVSGVDDGQANLPNYGPSAFVAGLIVLMNFGTILFIVWQS